MALSTGRSLGGHKLYTLIEEDPKRNEKGRNNKEGRKKEKAPRPPTKKRRKRSKTHNEME